MLLVRPKRGLHVLQCLIVPAAHVASFVAVELAVLRDLDMWKGCLIAMFRACRSTAAPAGLECIFAETALDLGGARRHAVIEVIPVVPSVMGNVGMHFRKDLMEQGEEWSTNPKIVESWGKRIAQCVPKDFPYCHIEWNRDREATDDPDLPADEMPAAIGGLLHVVDDPKRFPRSFVRSVVGGLLGLDAMELRNPVEETLVKKLARIKKFKQLFQRFDWTAQ